MKAKILSIEKVKKDISQVFLELIYQITKTKKQYKITKKIYNYMTWVKESIKRILNMK